MLPCRGQVLSTLDELRTITTHDDNLERQYKEGERDIQFIDILTLIIIMPMLATYTVWLNVASLIIAINTVVAENTQLNSALEKARGDIRVRNSIYL